ncbi:MAG: helix-turn-helix domain-containing protein [Actinomycetota bacterium]|nr:helix-turn-helix domain-containing protein [Actinomycetota bacterium]
MRTTTFDPVSILGCTPDEARSVLQGRAVTPGEVEAVARSHYPWRKHLHDDGSYWVVASQAARILRVSPGQVTTLLQQRRLRYVTHRSGVRLMRRSDVEAFARRVGAPMGRRSGERQLRGSPR